MKKTKKTLLAALMLSAASTSVTSAQANPDYEAEMLAFSAVYGPPPSYEENTEHELIYGDLNGDKLSDLTDLSILSVYLMTRKEGSNLKNLSACDVDGNGTIDIADLARFRQYISKDPNVTKLGPQEE